MLLKKPYQRELDMYYKLSHRIKEDLAQIDKRVYNMWQLPPAVAVNQVREAWDQVIERIPPNTLEVEYIPIKNMNSISATHLKLKVPVSAKGVMSLEFELASA